MSLLHCLRLSIRRSSACLTISSAVWLGVFSTVSTQAQTLNPEPLAQPLAPEDALFEQLLGLPSSYDLGNFDFVFSSEVARDWPVVTEETTSLYQPTLPSLWWSRDELPTLWRVTSSATVRIEGYRLVRNWLAFQSTTANAAIVDVQVDPQYWNRFNYFQKYAILTRMGATGMNYGHHVRLYSSISLVGVHACDFSSVRTFTESPGNQIPIAQLDGVSCAAAVGPFIDFTSPEFGDDLFAPP
ncbi:MAG: hypothetical protein AAF892_15310 [Cyanobacteria bacterium P01_D01_bin.71]